MAKTHPPRQVPGRPIRTVARGNRLREQTSERSHFAELATGRSAARTAAVASGHLSRPRDVLHPGQRAPRLSSLQPEAGCEPTSKKADSSQVHIERGQGCVAIQARQREGRFPQWARITTFVLRAAQVLSHECFGNEQLTSRHLPLPATYRVRAGPAFQPRVNPTLPCRNQLVHLPLPREHAWL